MVIHSRVCRDRWVGAGIDDVVVGLALVGEIEFVIAQGEDGLVARDLEDGEDAPADGIAHGHGPGLATTGTDGAQIAADVDEGVVDAQLAQLSNGQVDGVSLGNKSKIEFEAGIPAL